MVWGSGEAAWFFLAYPPPELFPSNHIDDAMLGYNPKRKALVERAMKPVEKMLRELFGHQPEECHKIAKNVDTDGRAVVLTTTMEHAELKRDQIHAYGKDYIESSKGSMWSTIEPDR